jgi:glycosyltransferase involved in cell wall biosynthesis
MDNSLSILIPIYNEEQSISGTVGIIRDTLSKSDFNWEIICINDGSTDRSKEVLSTIEDVRVINHKTNKGYGAALKSGIRLASFPYVCITDADGTYPNDQIPFLFNEMLKNNIDMIIGSRTGVNVTYPFIKSIPKFIITTLANYISDTRIPDINSGLRIFKKDQALEFIHLYPNGFSFTTTITMAMICSELNVEFFPVDYYKRQGRSKIRPWKDTVGFFNLLLKIALYFNPFKFFRPIILLFLVISIYFLIRDVFYLKDLTQGSVFFPIVTLIFFTLGLMSDLIIKRK